MEIHKISIPVSLVFPPLVNRHRELLKLVLSNFGDQFCLRKYCFCKEECLSPSPILLEWFEGVNKQHRSHKHFILRHAEESQKNFPIVWQKEWAFNGSITRGGIEAKTYTLLESGVPAFLRKPIHWAKSLYLFLLALAVSHAEKRERENIYRCPWELKDLLQPF